MNQTFLCVLIILSGSVLNSVAQGSQPTAEESFDQIIKLRLEVEEKNTLWEQEKKRLQSEYDTLVGRTNEVQAEVLRKRSQLEILKARGASSAKRSERKQTISGIDRKNLLAAIADFKKVSDATLPFGRSEIRRKLDRIAKDLSEGRGTVDEVAIEFAQILKSELKLARGVHLVKEEVLVQEEVVAVEAALVGSYTAFFAASDGRVGKWNPRRRKTEWIETKEEKARTLSRLAQARSATGSNRPVILDIKLEEL